MKLDHAVVTSVDRDDLPDLGAGHWAHTIREIKRLNPQTTIEVLIPDFQGRMDLVDLVIEENPDIISHNMETVRRISPLVRSAANYDTSLQVIGHVAGSGIKSKSRGCSRNRSCRQAAPACELCRPRCRAHCGQCAETLCAGAASCKTGRAQRRTAEIPEAEKSRYGTVNESSPVSFVWRGIFF